jgi:hypothetical protein
MGYVCKKYTVIGNHNFTMITSCNEMVNLNRVVTSVLLTLNDQLLCIWHMVLMHTIMSHVWLSKGP